MRENPRLGWHLVVAATLATVGVVGESGLRAMGSRGEEGLRYLDFLPPGPAAAAVKGDSLEEESVIVPLPKKVEEG